MTAVRKPVSAISEMRPSIMTMVRDLVNLLHLLLAAKSPPSAAKFSREPLFAPHYQTQ